MEVFSTWLDRWGLTPDGEPFETRYAKNWLLPVRQDGRPAMLKVASSQEEIDGAALMAWWAGEGAARVLERQDEALLLERLPVARSLADMARKGDDDEASRILCAVADQLHAPRPVTPPESLVPFDAWFRALAPAAAVHGGVLREAQSALEVLLAAPQDIRVLHGDLHHENVLDGGERGWLVIDPKGLLGERGYDYATMLCNPDEATALAPGRLARQMAVVAEAARLDRERLGLWLLAHAGVSAAWCLAEGAHVRAAFAVAEMARANVQA